MIRLLCLLLAFAAAPFTLFAQSQVVISIPDVVATGQETSICVPVTADSFPNIVVVQFAVLWDTNEVDYQEIRLGDNPLGFDDMATSNPAPGEFRVGFIPSDGQGITLEPGTVLFELCFAPKNNAGFTPLSFFRPGFQPEFTQFPSFDPFDFDTIPGSISYGSTVATTVLPGDTDVNGQVDHRDLLNIGLLHGQTGPARTDGNSDFEFQTAPRWPGNLDAGPNYAQVDANGDGTIDVQDLDLVNAYYAREADGNFEFAPTVSSPAGPVLNVVLPETVDAGQETTLEITLGDGNDPDAVGYGLAFTLQLDPEQVDLDSPLNVDFSGSFLGDDLLATAVLNDRAEGILEVALSRKDQTNTTVPGGRVMRLTFTTLPPATAGENYTLTVNSFPNAYLRADQTSAPISSGTGSTEVLSGDAVRTPAWAEAAGVFPNPTSDLVNVRGLTATPAPLTYTVYSRWGEKLLEARYTGRAISLGELPAGLYLLTLSDGAQRWTQPVTVSK